MTLSPDTRALAAVAAWTVAALLVVAWPWLWPALLGAAAVLAALMGWDLLLLRRLPSIRVMRVPPARAFVGRDAAIAIVVTNDGDAPVEVDVVDAVASDVATADPQFAAVAVAARTRRTLHYTVRPTVRGDRPFGALVVLARSPLGFLRRRSTYAGGAWLRVYPDASRFLRPEALDPRRVFAAIGVRPSPRRGEGMEFESLRDYVPGDDPRRIDWAASARRGRPVTRLFQHERNHTVILALDTSRLMAGEIGARTKLDYAVDAALALAYAALACGDRVGLTLFDRRVHGHLAPRAQRHDLGQFVELLRPVQPRRVEADYRELVRRLAVSQRQRALVIIVTDFVEADAAMLTEPLTVLARRHRVMLVAVRDRLYEALAPTPPAEPDDARALYRRLVLSDVLGEREAALAILRRCGLQTLDLVPEALTAAVLNRYLAIRYGPER